MKVIYSNQEPYVGNDKSAFLVGPTSRNKEVPSWRPRAIEILEQSGFDGTILVPEPANGFKFPNYYNQIDWEFAGLENCELIIAWVPRELQTMPAFTTNVEFGFWMGKKPSKVLYGRPDDAAHIRYLDVLYKKYNGKEPINSLEELLTTAVDILQ